MGADEFRVLVVCTGNVNRSALGAALLESWAASHLDASLAERVSVGSAGIGAPVGAPMGPRTLAIAQALGVDGSRHRAVQVTDEAIRRADLVLASSVRQRDRLLADVPGALRSTFTIREAGRLAELMPPRPAPGSVQEMRDRVAELARNRALATAGGDIIDPQGKDDAAFRQMAREEVPPLARLARVLLGMPPGDVAEVEAAVEAAGFPLGEVPPGPVDPRSDARGRTR